MTSIRQEHLHLDTTREIDGSFADRALITPSPEDVVVGSHEDEAARRMERAFARLMSTLTDDEREALDLVVHGRLTYRVAAAQMGWLLSGADPDEVGAWKAGRASKADAKKVHRTVNKALEKLRDRLADVTWVFESAEEIHPDA